MTEIKPALTAEQWMQLESDSETTIERYWQEIAQRRGLPGRHAIAATALYKMPFGFTRDDVDDLRAILQRLIPHEGTRDAKVVLSDIADRIDALLPPESVLAAMRGGEQ